MEKERIRSVTGNMYLVWICIITVLAVFSGGMVSAAEEPIVIGNICGLSGLLRTSGNATTAGAELAISEINAAGGIMGRQVKLVSRDDEGRPTTAVKMLQQLREAEGVSLFLGGGGSGVTIAMAPLLEKIDAVMIITAAASADITGSRLVPTLFRVCYENATVNFALAEFLHKKYPSVHKWAGINQDYVWGKTSMRFFSDRFKKIDPEFSVVADRWITFGVGGGFGAHINAMLTSGAEGVFSSLVGTTDTAAFIREAKAYGLFEKMKVVAFGHTDFSDPVAIGKDMASFWTVAQYYDKAFDNPNAKSFNKHLTEKMGKDGFFIGQSHAANGYDGIYAYKAAIEKAKTVDPGKVAKALEGIRIDSPFGEKVIRAEDHQSYHLMPFLHFVADPADPRGWNIDQFTPVQGADYILPIEERLKL